MSLWVDKYRPTSLSKLDYHKDLATHLRKLVSLAVCKHGLFRSFRFQLVMEVLN